MLAPALNRTARDAAYLTLGLATSVLAFAVWVAALTLSLTLAILIVGIPVIIGSAYVMRWTAELDRQNAALVFGRPVRGHYRSHRAFDRRARAEHAARPAGLARPRLADHPLGRRLRASASSRSRWSRPRRARGAPALVLGAAGRHEIGLWNVDTLPEAVATAFLAVPLALITVWLLRGMAKLHASLAVEFLGRR